MAFQKLMPPLGAEEALGPIVEDLAGDGLAAGTQSSAYSKGRGHAGLEMQVARAVGGGEFYQ